MKQLNSYKIFAYYAGMPSQDKDFRIRELAKNYNGDEGGSGYCFIDKERDLSFTFKDEEEIHLFIAKASLISGVRIEIGT